MPKQITAVKRERRINQAERRRQREEDKQRLRETQVLLEEFKNENG